MERQTEKALLRSGGLDQVREIQEELRTSAAVDTDDAAGLEGDEQALRAVPCVCDGGGPGKGIGDRLEPYDSSIEPVRSGGGSGIHSGRRRAETKEPENRNGER
jgi:hypothetical protein